MSTCKVYCSEKLSAVVDRALQVMGGSGTSHDTAVARIDRNIRPFRLYDGPSEVHRWAMGRDIMKGAVRRGTRTLLPDISRAPS